MRLPHPVLQSCANPGLSCFGTFPTDQTDLKVLYLVIRSPRPNRANVTGTTTGWKSAFNALALYQASGSPKSRTHHRFTHKDPHNPLPGGGVAVPGRKQAE